MCIRILHFDCLKLLHTTVVMSPWHSTNVYNTPCLGFKIKGKCNMSWGQVINGYLLNFILFMFSNICSLLFL